MRPSTTTHRWRQASLLALAMTVAIGVHAQRAVKPAAGHDLAADELLHKHDKEITFTENQGQFSEGVLFRADFPLGQALATRDGMLMKSYDPEAVQARINEGMRIEQEMHDGKPMRPLIWRERGHGWLMHFRNASAEMRIESREAHEEPMNYFVGGVQALNVRSYNEVWYTNVYSNIDARYYPAADGALEYDIICKPGSDPRNVAIEFKGIERLSVNARGELVMPTSLGEMTYPAPVVYQVINGRERKVDARYTVGAGNVLGFELGAYDKSQALVIDPIAMRWATWVNTNSSGDNHGHAIWVDPTDGAIYVVARVVGTTDNITVGAFDVSANGNLEMIVGKYLEPGTVGGAGTRVWQTYIGGGGDDNPYAMEQGPDGNLYITGQTSSTNFPLLGGPDFSGSSLNQQSQSDIDVFVLKINTAGNSIKAAVVGGNGADDNYDVRLAANGDVFVSGSTTSTNLLTLNAGSGASNTNNGSSDVFVFRINQDLSSLVWMRNYGGSGADRASIMLHNATNGDLFVGGNTSSTNFPTVSPRQNTRGGTTAGFLQRMNGTTAATTWSSYFSSDANDDANLLCMEFNATKTELYFGGVTEGLNSANVSASGVFDNSHNGNNDFYVARMDIDQNFLDGTYVGGTSNEVNMMGLNVDLNNDVYVFGYTSSTNFPVSASPNVPLQTTNNGSNDKVFFKLESDLSALEFSTYYGGTNDDYDPVGERGIKFSNCRIYTIVTAQSNNIPLTQGALNTTKTSPTSRYEPGLVVWANPPDLLGNSITYQGTAICAGSMPGDIIGSVPTYTLPTVVRNNSASAYPAFPSAATYQWQISLDSVNWTDISGATGQNLVGTDIGIVNQTTYIRRIIGGDACILAGAADQVVTVRLMSVTGTVTNALCNGDATGSITANADGLAPFDYLWSNGQTTQTATNLAAGNYSVTVTDANGCEASNNFDVGQPSAVDGSAQVTDATCSNSNGSATASGSGGTPGYSYEWNTGAVGPTLSGVPAGAYSVTITDSNGCTFVLLVTINGTGVPNANAGADAVITCLNNGQVVLDGSSSTPGVTYSWSGPGIVSGGSSEDVTVNAAGTYTLTVTNQQTGCSSNDQAEVTLDNATPGAQATGGELTCEISSVQLSGNGNGSFAWTGPNGFTSADQNPTVSEAGTYVLAVTGANGCTSMAQADVTLDNAVPGAQATGGVLTCSVTSVQLFGTGNGTFSWTGPNGFTSGDQNPTVSEAGTYVLTVTGANGCTSMAQADVTLDNATPGAQATGGVLTCSVTSVQLLGSGNGTYSWTGPNGFTSGDQNPTVSEAGTYVLTVTGANGCTSMAQADVTLDNAAPGAQATGGVLTCTTTSVQLFGTGNGSFSWTGPNGFTSNDQNPIVSEAGTYVLTVTGTNGCTSMAQADVTLDNATPGAQATGGTLTCTTTSVQLFGTGNGSFSWTGPNGFTSNDQNPIVSVAGDYELTVTGANGCTSLAQTTVAQDANVPDATAVGGTLTCNTPNGIVLNGGSTTLGVGFSWTGPNGFTSGDEDPTVTEPGLYVLTVTNPANGCSNTAQASVGQDIALPGASAQGGVIDCINASVMLMGSGNGTFSWTGPNGFTSGDQNPTVSEAGTYVLAVTGANGCTSMAQADVTLDNAAPGAQATGSVLTCAITSVQLSGNGNGSFAWTGPNAFTSGDQNPTVSEAGTYVLTVTGANGCTSMAQADVTLDNATPGAQATGGVLTCANTSVQLNGSGNGSFSWTGPNGFTSGDQNPTVTVAGTYELTVTGANGCVSIAQADVTEDGGVPGAQATGGTLTCSTTSVQLLGGGNGTFSWTGPNGFTSGDQNPVVSEAGTYVLTVTGANGCTSMAQADVTLDNATPGAQATGGTLTCTITSVQLFGTGNGTFSWTGPNGFTSNDQNPMVSEAGIYVLTVTGANGCTSMAQADVTLDNATPGAQATGGVLTCSITSVQLLGSGNGTFSWTGPNGFTSGDQNPSVSEAGTYVLTVTGANGCTSMAQADVTFDNATPDAQATGGVLTCTTTSVQLFGTGNGTFSWTGPNGFTSADQNPTVSEAGNYVLTVTGANGCTSMAQADVTQDADVPGAQATGGVLTCSVTSVQLFGTGNGTFSWTGPNGFTSGDQNPTVSEAGTYVLTVTGANGCTSMAQADVTLDADVPSAQATGGVLTCNNQSVMLTGSGNGSFSWAGPNGFSSGDQNPVVSEAGTYILTVTSANGCTSMANAFVTLDNATPGAQASGGVLTCNDQSVVLTGSGIGSFSWTGPNGFTSGDQNPIVAEAGTYVLTVTGSNGCVSMASATVSQDIETPEINAVGGVLDCLGNPVQLDGYSSMAGSSFAWSSANGFSSGDEDPFVTMAGFYTLTVTGPNGCTNTTDATVTQADCGGCTLPLIIACGPDTTVACGTSLDALVVGPPILRKDLDCPLVNYFVYADTLLSACPMVIQRTWTIGDEAGNWETCVQMITVMDTVGPVIYGVPADMTVDCTEDLTAPTEVWAEDGCFMTGEPIVKDEIVPGACKGSYTIIRTWYAEDMCGNGTLATQLITVIDTVAPVIDCGLDAKILVDCASIPEPVKCTAIDNCGDEVEVTSTSNWITDIFGNVVLERVYSAVDDCGNASSFTQIIFVNDGPCKDGGEEKLMVTAQPNPFMDMCNLRFMAPEHGQAIVTVHDASGRLVAEAFNSNVEVGQNISIQLQKERLGFGLYEYRVVLGTHVARGTLMIQ
ncbi:MAG: hypothetical protein KA230_02070 [Flavobacteriales bacterium]|nr:hypothetical protein [Flavobacteriales bacterium]